MRRRCTIAICMALLAAAAAAEIIDRIAVSVGNRVITQTDIDREIRITALLNNQKPDFSPASRRQAAERMVDQTLIRGELEASSYLAPSPADIETALQEEKSRFGDDAVYRRALAEYGVSEDDLKARLAWQLTLVRFIDVRFRPGIQIGEPEILKYFDEHMRAALVLAHPGQTPSVDDYRDGIEQKLIGQAADQQVEQWLKEARGRTHIQYREEVFQ
jgi:SurA N-terminal domain